MTPFPPVTIDKRQTGRSVHLQISAQIRSYIQNGIALPGNRLPSSRELADRLGLSRSTIVKVYEDLEAEGLIVARRGGGSFVAERQAAAAGEAPAPELGATAQPAHLADLEARPFWPDYPSVSNFPFRLWAQLSRPQANSSDVERHLTTERDADGPLSLRHMLAQFMRRTRGISCEAANVFVFAGHQQARDVVLRTVLLPGDAVAVEDPAHPKAWRSLEVAHARCLPVRHGGMHAAVTADPAIRLSYVVNRKPLLGNAAELALDRDRLQQATARNAGWIVEDDQSEDFDHTANGAPTLDTPFRQSRLIYVASFSRSLSPALPFGFAVVPDELCDGISRMRLSAGGYAPLLEHRALATFIARGHLTRHIAEMRTIYARRQELLREVVAEQRIGWLTVLPQSEGLNAVARFELDLPDVEIARQALAAGVYLSPFSVYTRLEPVRPPLMVLGVGAFQPAAIEAAVVALKRLFGS